MHKSIPAVFCLTLVVAATATAEIEVGTGLRVITPDPLLPVSGGMGPVPLMLLGWRGRISADEGRSPASRVVSIPGCRKTDL
ncbi:MAG: hypothetical protein ABIP48_14775 [Planctomycetota bacterium]